MNPTHIIKIIHLKAYPDRKISIPKEVSIVNPHNSKDKMLIKEQRGFTIRVQR